MRNSCYEQEVSSNYRSRYQKRRLRFLNHIRDAMERRMAALDASIKTLEAQIEREDNIENNLE